MEYAESQNKFSLPKLIMFIKRWIEQGYFGEIRIKFESGTITYLEERIGHKEI